MKFENEKVQLAYDKMVAFFNTQKPVEEIVTTEQKFTDAKLQTGEIIQYDAPELSQGVVVNLVTPEGILPIPDGEYLLEDGSKLVTSGGLVAEYVKVEESPEGEVVEPTTPATPQAGAMEQPSAPKRVIKSQVEEHVFHLELEGFEPIKVDFSSLIAPLVKENKELKETLKETFEAVKELGNEPSVKPTEKVKLFATKQDRAEIKEAFKKLTK
jgi:hypothetical protein